MVASVSHRCFVSAAGTADCAGLNQYGQLSGTTNNGSGAPNPTPISATIPGGQVTQVAPTFTSTCALTSAGEVWCYGDNFNGELGNSSNLGTDAAHPTPTKVAGIPSPAIAIGAGATHACAALNTGALACWGNNGAGELGQPVATTRSATPLVAPGVNLLDAPGPIALKVKKPKFKFAKSGRKISAKSTIRLTGTGPLTKTACKGKITATFSAKKKRVARGSFKLSFKKGACQIKLSQKLPGSVKGKKLKLALKFGGLTRIGDSDISALAKTFSVKVPRSIR
jgi:hypothetical protein